jgi:hypothetical protein
MPNVPSSRSSSLPDAAAGAPDNQNGSLILSPISSDPPLSRSLFDGPTTGVGVAMRALDRPDSEEKIASAPSPQPLPSSNGNYAVLDPAIVSALVVGITQGMRDLLVNELKVVPSARSDGVPPPAPSDNAVCARRSRRTSESGMSAPAVQPRKKKISFITEQKARIRTYNKSIKGALSIVKEALKIIDKSIKKAEKYRSSLTSNRSKLIKKNRATSDVVDLLFNVASLLDDLALEMQGQIEAARTIGDKLLEANSTGDDDAVESYLETLDEIIKSSPLLSFRIRYNDANDNYSSMVQEKGTLAIEERPDFITDLVPSLPTMNDGDIYRVVSRKSKSRSSTLPVISESDEDNSGDGDDHGEAEYVPPPLGAPAEAVVNDLVNDSIYTMTFRNSENARQSNTDRVQNARDAESKSNSSSSGSFPIGQDSNPDPPPPPSDDDSSSDDSEDDDSDDEKKPKRNEEEEKEFKSLRLKAKKETNAQAKRIAELQRQVARQAKQLEYDKQYYASLFNKKDERTTAASKYLKDLKPSSPDKIYSEIKIQKMDIYDSFIDFEKRLARQVELAKGDGVNLKPSEDLKIHLFESWLESPALRDTWLSRSIGSMVYSSRKEYFISTYGLKAAEVNFDYHACKWDGKEGIRAFHARLIVIEERYCRYNKTPITDAFLRTSFIEHLGDTLLKDRIMNHLQTNDNIGNVLTRNDLVNQADLELTNWLRSRAKRAEIKAQRVHRDHNNNNRNNNNSNRNINYDNNSNNNNNNNSNRGNFINAISGRNNDNNNNNSDNNNNLNNGNISAISKNDSYGKRGNGGRNNFNNNNNNGNNSGNGLPPWKQAQIDRGCKFCSVPGHYQEMCPQYRSAQANLNNKNTQSSSVPPTNVPNQTA